MVVHADAGDKSLNCRGVVDGVNYEDQVHAAC